MERLNTVVNDNRKFYYKLLTNTDCLITREIALVAGNKMEGLLPFSIITKESGVELRYEISALAKLSDYIKNIQQNQTFYNLVLQILNIMNNLNQSDLLFSKLILDLNEILIDIYANKIYFIYIPLDGYNAGYSFPDFLLIMLDESGLDKQGSFYLQCKSYITTNKLELNLSEFENFIKMIMPQNEVGQSEEEINNLITIHNILNESTPQENEIGTATVPIDFKNISTIGMSNTRKLN